MYKHHILVAVFFGQALFTPAMGWSSDWRTILKQTKKSAPPKELSSTLNALAKLGFSPRPEHKDGWFAWTPGCNNVCQSFMLCWGLERSYRAQLRGSSKRGGYNFNLWAWVYDSAAHRKLAQEAYDWQAAVNRFKVVLESKGTLLVVFEGRGPAPDAGQLAAALQHPLPAHDRPGWGIDATPAPACPGWRADATPAAPSPLADPPARPRLTPEMLRKRLQDPNTPDSELEGLVCQGAGPGVNKLLNRRGMHFYKRRDWARASIAFEAAARVEDDFALPLYNRACVAALQGDAPQAVLWLWKVLHAPFMYGTTGTFDSEKLLRRARSDNDFASIRRTPEFRAFKKCL